jgi:hypothetical protein
MDALKKPLSRRTTLKLMGVTGASVLLSSCGMSLGGPDPSPDPGPNPGGEPDPKEPLRRAYGMTKAEWLNGTDGTPIDQPVMKNHDPKWTDVGMDWIHGIRYDPIAVAPGKQVAFGPGASGGVAWTTLGNNPGYENFGLLYVVSASPNTARWGSTLGSLSYPNIPNWFRFKAVRGVKVYIVTPPTETAFPENYNAWEEEDDLEMENGTVSKVRSKVFPEGDVELPGLQSVYRSSNTGILAAFMIAEADGSPYVPPHPDLQPLATRPEAALEIFKTINPHLLVQSEGKWTGALTFGWHPLRDRFGLNWGHLHELHQPFADTYYELSPELISQIPNEMLERYPIGKNHHPQGKITHSDFWDFEYEVYDSVSREPLKFLITMELGSQPDPKRILKQRREVRVCLAKEDGTIIFDVQWSRPAGVKRTVANGTNLPLPSGVVQGRHYPVYTRLDPDNPTRDAEEAIDVQMMEDDGGYNNIKWSPPAGMGMIGYVNVNVPARGAEYRKDTGSFQQIDGVWCWVLNDNPDLWLQASGLMGTERWSNLNQFDDAPPGAGLGFSYNQLLQKMVESRWRGVKTTEEANKLLAADNYWYYSSYDGERLETLPGYGIRRQYHHPDAELYFQVLTNPQSTTGDNRFISYKLFPTNRDDTYRPLFAGDEFDKPGVDRNDTGFITTAV